ncbi:MAG: GDP-mannose 4,6-dehydratase [Bdellovibrionota bacterium]
MRILITGGAGFIGSHLAESLAGDGHHVVLLDDFSTGSAENLSGLSGKDVETVQGSVLDEPLVRRLCQGVDRIYHLAAAVGVRYVIDHPLQTLLTNVEGAAIVFRAANEKGIPILVTSTSEVYGKNPAIPLREDADSVTGAAHLGRWSYACTKALDEFMAIAYWREKKLPTVVVRLFNTVGPRQTGRYGMVIPRFVAAALSGEPLEVHGDGQQSRTFCDVEDAVRGMRALLEAPSARGEIFNIGGTEEITIENLARRIVERTGSKSPVMLVPYEQAFERDFEDMRRRVPDVSKARKFVGYEPRYGLDEILDRVIAYHRGRSQGASSAGPARSRLTA